jgi:hypothetical protein
MALVGTGRLRLLPLAATAERKLSSPASHSSRHQEILRPAVLHYVAALQVQRM